MWTVLKIKKNSENILRSELEKKLKADYYIYAPKISFLTNSNKPKRVEKIINLLDDYIFCYSEKFKDKEYINSIKFCRGLKKVFINTENSQTEIVNFINRCKKYEIKNQILHLDFFKVFENKNYKFLSGPFSNYIVEVLNVQKEKIKLLIGNFKLSINKKNYLLKQE